MCGSDSTARRRASRACASSPAGGSVSFVVTGAFAGGKGRASHWCALPRPLATVLTAFREPSTTDRGVCREVSHLSTGFGDVQPGHNCANAVWWRRRVAARLDAVTAEITTVESRAGSRVPVSRFYILAVALLVMIQTGFIAALLVQRMRAGAGAARAAHERRAFPSDGDQREGRAERAPGGAAALRRGDGRGSGRRAGTGTSRPTKSTWIPTLKAIRGSRTRKSRAAPMTGIQGPSPRPPDGGRAGSGVHRRPRRGVTRSNIG